MTNEKIPALFSTREAMQRAGVPDWQIGGGVSSADAIDFIAEQRDRWKLGNYVLAIINIALALGCLWQLF